MRHRERAPTSSGRAKITVRGAVQGVGFRPFVYRLATELNLVGWVLNSAQGVFIEVEGTKEVLDHFLLRLEKEKPPRAVIQSLEFSFLDPVGYDTFEIRQSDDSGKKSVLVLPDIATCSDCLREIFDRTDRRHLYPFTNCTNCGPRFSIIEALPYDRPNTSMKKFTMCPECQKEYNDPLNRRFHAQPNACANCGPHLELWDERGDVLSRYHDALLEAAKIVQGGKILALKGLGGFLFIVDARNEAAVIRLRERKHREEKPFALMFPSLEAVKNDCEVSEFEERLLLSPESPIVLLNRKSSIPARPAGGENWPDPTGGRIEVSIPQIGIGQSPIAPSVAPKNPYLGVMLPYTPLHHILMRELHSPVVATSGNLKDEPICTDEHEALDRLHGIADVFLVHNRPIVRHVDDSVARVVLGRELILRRARGYAPLPIHVKESLPTMLAVGGHLKNTVALSFGNNVFISQHIGDLETKEATSAFRRVISDFLRLYESKPELVACDMHPEYLSTKYAQELGLPTFAVQHHYAHVIACMAENELEPPVLGVAWDGTGYGLDGTIWGGEFLLTNEDSFTRVAHIRQFKLPGGEVAIKQPRRTALGVLYEIFGEKVFERKDLIPIQNFSEGEVLVLQRMLEKGINSPITSSVGRLFDAVASIIGVRQRVSFEGQAAMELEFAIGNEQTNEQYEFRIVNCDLPGNVRADPTSPLINYQSPIVIDWEPMMLQILEDTRKNVPPSAIAAKFHNTLAEIIVEVARKVGEQKLILTGGCFQNKYLTERTVRRLQTEGFRPYWHQRIPPNDGGIALGQIVTAVKVKSFKRKREPSYSLP